MVSGPELNAIQALASRNFFNPNMMEGGSVYPQSDKKILHLGYAPIILLLNLITFYTFHMHDYSIIIVLE